MCYQGQGNWKWVAHSNLELYRANKEKAILKRELDSCRQELKEALQQFRNRKRARRMKKGRETFARWPIATNARDGASASDPQHPHYGLDGYISRESLFDHETIKTEESMADNFKTTWMQDLHMDRMMLMDMYISSTRCEKSS